MLCTSPCFQSAQLSRECSGCLLHSTSNPQATSLHRKDSLHPSPAQSRPQDVIITYLFNRGVVFLAAFFCGPPECYKTDICVEIVLVQGIVEHSKLGQIKICSLHTIYNVALLLCNGKRLIPKYYTDRGWSVVLHQGKYVSERDST